MVKKTKGAKKTKKVKSSGRLGARYGRSIRQNIRDVEVKQKAKHPCPFCGKKRVVRRGTGKWECKSCGREIAGGAYTLETELGRVAKRIVRVGAASAKEKEEK